MTDKVTPDNTKTFNFTGDELNFLAIRHQIMNLSSIINQDTKSVMEAYIMSNVLPRLKIDPNKHNITYNVVAGTLTLSDKIIVPTNGAK